MGALILRLKTWWQSADRTQKLITVCGGGFLVVLLIGTFVFASRPKMELAFSSLAPEDTGNVAMEIENMGVPVTFDNGGNVFVPSDKRAMVRATLAMKGKLPKGGSRVGEALKGLPAFGDKSIQDEQIKAIQESELSQSIEFFENVDSASVQITPSKDSPFEGEKKPAQANVTIAEKAGGLVTQDQARAMANLVSSAVPGLETSKVSIFTRTGRALWDGQEQESGTGTTNKKLALQKDEARKKRDEIQEALNRMVGPNNAIAMVDLTLDLNETEKSTTNIDPTKPIDEQKVTEGTTAGTGSGAGMATGVQGNTPDSPTIGGGGSSSNQYSLDQQHIIHGTHTTQEHVKVVGGDLKSMAITILVNKTEKMTEEAMKPIEDLAKSSLGPQAVDTEHFTSKVVAYPFDKKEETDAKTAAASAAGGARMQQIMSILPILALIVVAFMVIKSIGKLANRPMAGPMMAMAGGPALYGPSDGLGHATNAFGMPAKSLEGANRFVLPEIVKQKALEAGISEEQLHAAIEEAGDAGISIEDIPSIKSRINVPLEQIKKMAHEKPEVVAMLVKSWLIEEGIRR